MRNEAGHNSSIEGANKRILTICKTYDKVPNAETPDALYLVQADHSVGPFP